MKIITKKELLKGVYFDGLQCRLRDESTINDKYMKVDNNNHCKAKSEKTPLFLIVTDEKGCADLVKTPLGKNFTDSDVLELFEFLVDELKKKIKGDSCE